MLQIMNNKLLMLGMAFAVSCAAAAQDIYQMESFSSQDLNGTARYVGMGGAMSALGADLTTMNTNPAGIGLYRRGDVNTSLSINTQEDGQKFDDKGKTHVSFDNLGFVYAAKIGGSTCKFVNFAFNYKKRKNFNQLINTSNNLPNGGSQTWQMADLVDYWGSADKATPLASMGYQNYLINEDGTDWYNASSNAYRRAQWGSIQEYDFNISTNLSEQFYLGLTVGAFNVDYNAYSSYMENLLDAQNAAAGTYELTNARDISGSGVNVMLGFIARPIKESPFRVGIAVSTPTYFNLTYKNTSDLYTRYSDDDQLYHQYTDARYDYNIHTPWRFNFSLGHTIANCLAIGAEYEFADYSSAKVSYDDGWDYDGWTSETKDRELNHQASERLKGVSTFKLGAEWMVDPTVAIRAGYNYVSSPFKDSAFADQTINSASLDYTTTTSYLNLGGINRYTVGVGLTFGNFYVDAACQYQHQRGHFYAFNAADGNGDNGCEASRVNLSRTQVLFTVGYRF